jgi:hypothetical protein
VDGISVNRYEVIPWVPDPDGTGSGGVPDPGGSGPGWRRVGTGLYISTTEQIGGTPDVPDPDSTGSGW